jgi:hypothetical protein
MMPEPTNHDNVKCHVCPDCGYLVPTSAPHHCVPMFGAQRFPSDTTDATTNLLSGTDLADRFKMATDKFRDAIWSTAASKFVKYHNP